MIVVGIRCQARLHDYGFSSRQLGYCWGRCDDCVLRVFTTRKFVACLNATFIGNISKKVDAISWVGCICKLLLKAFTLWVRGAIGNLISENQNALLGGGQISDAALIANEVIDSRTKAGKPTSQR